MKRVKLRSVSDRITERKLLHNKIRSPSPPKRYLIIRQDMLRPRNLHRNESEEN
jgi:hypothetical protein